MVMDGDQRAGAPVRCPSELPGRAKARFAEQGPGELLLRGRSVGLGERVGHAVERLFDVRVRPTSGIHPPDPPAHSTQPPPSSRSLMAGSLDQHCRRHGLHRRRPPNDGGTGGRPLNGRSLRRRFGNDSSRCAAAEVGGAREPQLVRCPHAARGILPRTWELHLNLHPDVPSPQFADNRHVEHRRPNRIVVPDRCRSCPPSPRRERRIQSLSFTS
jgi:hypothetical protein